MASRQTLARSKRLRILGLTSNVNDVRTFGRVCVVRHELYATVITLDNISKNLSEERENCYKVKFRQPRTSTVGHGQSVKVLLVQISV